MFSVLPYVPSFTSGSLKFWVPKLYYKNNHLLHCTQRCVLTWSTGWLRYSFLQVKQRGHTKSYVLICTDKLASGVIVVPESSYWHQTFIQFLSPFCDGSQINQSVDVSCESFSLTYCSCLIVIRYTRYTRCHEISMLCWRLEAFNLLLNSFLISCCLGSVIFSISSFTFTVHVTHL